MPELRAAQRDRLARADAHNNWFFLIIPHSEITVPGGFLHKPPGALLQTECRARKSPLTVLFLFFIAGTSLCAEADPSLLTDGISIWQPSFAVRLGVGYKDNVTLNAYAPRGSGFENTSADAVLVRLPLNNWQFSLFASGADSRYFDSSLGVDTEQAAAIGTQLTWFFSPGWKNVSSFQYGFVNQVTDLSAIYGLPLRQQILGNTFNLKDGVRRDFERWWLELNASGTRSLYRTPLDNS